MRKLLTACENNSDLEIYLQQSKSTAAAFQIISQVCFSAPIQAGDLEKNQIYLSLNHSP